MARAKSYVGETSTRLVERSARHIACVTGAPSASIQYTFARLVEAWRASGIKVVGVVGESHGLPGRTCGAGILRDISTGTPYSIYLDTVPEDTSCHVDAAGVARASAAILGQISTADLVVLSKFGKLEAAGHGLAADFAAAIAAGKPLLTSVAGKHRAAWEAFAPGAKFLMLDEMAIRDWAHAILCP